MSVTIPPAYNYQSPLVAVPDNTFSEPKEGPKQINCTIKWGVDDGAAAEVMASAMRHYLRGIAADPDRHAFKV